MQFEELESIIENETAALEFAVKKRLLPDKKTLCPVCSIGNVGWYRRSNDGLKVPYSLRCSRKRCRKKWSVTKDTWFFGSHLTIKQNFMLIYLWIRGDNITDAAEQLKLSKTTVLDYYQFCREVCFVIVSNRTKPVGGAGHTVTINEFSIDRFIGAQKRRVSFIEGVDINSNDCFLIEIHVNNADTLISLIKKFVLAGSKILTEDWKSYSTLDSEYFHKAFEDHPVEFVSRECQEVKNNKVKCMWRSGKRFVAAEGQAAKTCDLLLFQYLYFHPMENLSTGEKFERFLEDIAKVYPGPFKNPLTAVIY